MMAIVNRLTRLLQADLHAVLDNIEEPLALLKQSVREMEEELSRSEVRIKSLSTECEISLKRETELEQTLLQIDEELEVCFDSGNDDLARPLVKRKLEMQRFLKSMVRKREDLQEQHAEAQELLNESKTRYESMRQKAELLSEESSSIRNSHNDSYSWVAPDLIVREEEVEVALLREKKIRAQQQEASS